MEANTVELRSITTLTAEESYSNAQTVLELMAEDVAKANPRRTFKALQEKYIKNLRTINGYAHVRHTGHLNKNISPLKLAIILDHGYSWFGGYASIKEDGSFDVKINTD